MEEVVHHEEVLCLAIHRYGVAARDAADERPAIVSNVAAVVGQQREQRVVLGFGHRFNHVAAVRREEEEPATSRFGKVTSAREDSSEPISGRARTRAARAGAAHSTRLTATHGKRGRVTCGRSLGAAHGADLKTAAVAAARFADPARKGCGRIDARHGVDIVRRAYTVHARPQPLEHARRKLSEHDTLAACTPPSMRLAFCASAVRPGGRPVVARCRHGAR
mmetsp:Transcript_26287/g.79778  ORF Transcript_26287/g.79778 Transcript_26287/m.79778 type:complete len:221 (+) Transcript_26287:1234-1896(+)